jgi:flagellar hook-associated protein 3 FlgL
VINGKDVNPITADGIFGDVAKLRDALKGNDPAGITAAAQSLKADYDRVVNIRGSNGARLQEISSRQTQLTDQNTATQSLLSNVQDADMTQTISQFQLLQTSLQASLTAASKALHLSLLDFLG